MKRVFAVGLTMMLIQFGVLAQSVEQSVEIKSVDGVTLRGTLLLPSLDQDEPVPVALIVSDGKSTDKDGNIPFMLNNSLKMLAEELMQQGIASLRYDKRGVRTSSIAGFDESKLTLEIYARDVMDWTKFLNQDTRFNNIIAIGHGEGAGLAMRAANYGANLNQIVLIAGYGRNLQTILKEQLSTQPDQIKNISYAIIDTLVKGKKYEGVPIFLNSMFRLSIQPSLIAEFKVEPTKLASMIKIPMLIIHGDTDIQVEMEDAKLLGEANKKAKVVILKNMNHVLKACEEKNSNAQVQYYTNPTLPLHIDLVPKIVEFIEKNIN